MSSTDHNDSGPAPVLNAWLTAFNQADLAGICALYTPDALLWGTSATTLTAGTDGVAAYFQAVFAVQPPPTIEVTQCLTRVQGDSAVLAGSYQLTARVHGEPRVVPARFLFALGRTAAGWRITAHHSSRLPTEPLLPGAPSDDGA